MLSFCLRSIYQNAPAHREIVLVWDDFVRDQPIDFDALRQDTGVDFRVVMQSQIRDWPERIGRWGWVKQQLAKLYCWRYVRTKWAWLVDGDVLITGDPELFSEGRPVLRTDPDSTVHESYRAFMCRYLGITQFNDASYVGSTALVDTTLCHDMDELCRRRSGMDLTGALDQFLADPDCPDYPISEFECYGHLLRERGACVVVPKNWNYVENETHWQRPIQILWADDPKMATEQRYHALINHKEPNQ